ncbi:hypothetical protein BHE74_00026782, partial [Ensete ventricosum]
MTKVCNFDLYRPVRTVHTGLPDYRSRRFRQKSTVGGRLREKSTIGDQLRKKKGRRRGKEKKQRRGEERIPRLRAVLARLPSPPAGRLRAIASRGRFFSHARRRSVSQREETDLGD